MAVTQVFLCVLMPSWLHPEFLYFLGLFPLGCTVPALSDHGVLTQGGINNLNNKEPRQRLWSPALKHDLIPTKTFAGVGSEAQMMAPRN